MKRFYIKQQQIEVEQQGDRQVVRIKNQQYLTQIIQILFSDLDHRNKLDLLVKNNQQISVILEQQLLTQRFSGCSKSLDQIFSFQHKLSVVFSYYDLVNISRLHLVDINFNNCQFLQFMNLPSLQYLIVDQQRVHSLKSLNKANLPSIKQFRVNSNFFALLDLSRFRFSQHLRNLTLMFYTYSPIVNQDFSFIAKIQIHKSLILRLPQIMKIQQSEKIKVMCQKIKSPRHNP